MSCKICKLINANKEYFCVNCSITLKQKIINLNKDGKFDFDGFNLALVESNLGSCVEYLPDPIEMDGLVLDACALLPSIMLNLLDQDIDEILDQEMSETSSISNCSMPSLEKIE